MKTLVVYDSVYGNTEAIARAIGDALPGEVEVQHASGAAADGLQGYDLLIVGAPTHGAGPSPDAKEFLDSIQAPALEGVYVAGFDTRMTNWFLRLFGFAAPKITETLQQKGGTVAGEPGDFWVTGGKGPLKQGELERAARWAREMATSANPEA